MQLVWPLRPDVIVLAAYFATALPLQLWSYLATPLPAFNFEATASPLGAVYLLSGPFVSLLLWRQRPRARTGAYLFCTLEVVRSIARSHWLPAALAIAVVGYLQTPAMRRIYPSVWARLNSASRSEGRSPFASLSPPRLKYRSRKSGGIR